jgi:hypothetical protein
MQADSMRGVSRHSHDAHGVFQENPWNCVTTAGSSWSFDCAGARYATAISAQDDNLMN